MPSLIKSMALLPALFSALSHAVPTVEVKGQDFIVSETGKRFMIVGVDYQPGGQAGYKPQDGEDALTDAKACLRDAALMQRLGVNTIRVYNLDPTLNHDECASIFNAAGIYMILDVNSPLSGESINRAEPWTSYYAEYLERTFGVVENFKGYPNTLAFFAANEVMNDVPSSEHNPPYVRAVVRDLRNYIKNNCDRPFPVGYSAADVREILEDTWRYYECAIDGDEDDMSRSDFFGLNSYSWCGPDADFKTAGYDELTDMFEKSSIPVFFSEYGCNEVKPRVFNEVQALYSKQMIGAFSGGLIYEYSQEEADYGIVDINKNNTVTLRSDFSSLQEQYNKLDLDLLSNTDSTSKPRPAPECSKDLISDSGFNQNFTIPVPPPGADRLIKNGVGKDFYRGKLVDVKDLTSPYKVYTTSGAEVEDLTIEKVADNASNLPGGYTTDVGGEQANTNDNTSDEKQKGSANPTAVGKKGGAASDKEFTYGYAAALFGFELLVALTL